MSTRRNYTVAIIGGGASGTGLAARMVEALPVGLSTANLSIALFDTQGCRGGNAYADDTLSNLMNTTCGAIDRGFGGRFSFLRWATENPDSWQHLVGKKRSKPGLTCQGRWSAGILWTFSRTRGGRPPSRA